MLTWMILGLWRIKEIYEQKNMHACIVTLVVSDCDHMNFSLPDFFVHGILQARILEWDAMPSSRGSSPPRD